MKELSKKYEHHQVEEGKYAYWKDRGFFKSGDQTKFFCDALGKKPNPIHIPTDYIVKHLPEFAGELYGDKMHSAIFDNRKVKVFNPTYEAKYSYKDIAKKAVAHYMNNKELQTVNEAFEARLDALIEAYLKK
ncbi:MAG: hypothetical protein ACVCEJ_01575 [Candidatus Izemoplasmataceae bacterium]